VKQQPSNAEQVSSPPLPENLRLALAALALHGPANISRFCQIAGGAGARESEARAFSTQSLRVALEPYLQVGWVLESGALYECAYGLGPRLLRSFSKEALVQLGSRYVASLRGTLYSGHWSRAALETEVRLGLAGGHPEWQESLERLLAMSSPPEVTAQLLQEPLAVFERAWFDGFTEVQRRQLSALLLDLAEPCGMGMGDFAPYASEPTSVVQADPELQQRWARLQLLRAGADGVSSELSQALPASSGVGFLRRMVAGDFSGARGWCAHR
jgi:hypothetical protein